MVIITGATGGIGKALLKNVLLSEQMCVAIVRNVSNLPELFSNADASKLFLADYELNAFDELLPHADQYPITHITLVLNAFDITPIKKAVELSKEDISKNIEFNLAKQIEIITKSWEFSHHLGVSLRIVNLDSGASYQPISGWSMYCAGKAYMSMFLRVFSQENGIPLVLYDPGVVDTKMQRTIRNSDRQDFPLVNTFCNYQLSKQLHSPEEVAKDIWRRYLSNWTAVELHEYFNVKI